MAAVAVEAALILPTPGIDYAHAGGSGSGIEFGGEGGQHQDFLCHCGVSVSIVCESSVTVGQGSGGRFTYNFKS